MRGVVLLLAVLACSALAEDIKCYSCTATYEKGTENKVCPNTADDEVKKTLKTQTCDSAKGCLKTYMETKKDGKTAISVTRSCSTVDKKDECDKEKDTTTCYCEGDKCNGAGTKSLAAFVIVPLTFILGGVLRH